MSIFTRTFLVLLRLAIGWHLLVEGFDKVHSHYIGATETSKPWSSETYLRNASGPLAPYFRQIPGDLDAELISRMSQKREPPVNGAVAVWDTHMPAAVLADWDAYFSHFMHHFQLSDAQIAKARTIFDEQRRLTAAWFSTEKKAVKKAFPTGVADVPMTVDERLKEYQDKLAIIRDAEDRLLPAFGKDVMKQKLPGLKIELTRIRNELIQDVDDQTKRMKTELAKVLTPEQRKRPALDDPPRPKPWMQTTADYCTMFGLLIAGSCLLLGLFTRTACWAGVALLILFYSASPALPWLPENPRSEGHYIFVNKNVIEALALMALGTLPSGRWFGLDGLIHTFIGARRRVESEKQLANA
jgi:uncharacterized membrane protein YphA (DoxX/SURF4 family)